MVVKMKNTRCAFKNPINREHESEAKMKVSFHCTKFTAHMISSYHMWYRRITGGVVVPQVVSK